MPHCPPELLDDVADVMARIRGWAGVTERTAGVFYLRRQPFFHFHLLQGGRRRADVKGRSEWTQVDLPRPLTAAARRLLLGALESRYRERLGTATGPDRSRRPKPSPRTRT